MPRLYQRKARADIYESGKKTKANNKQGYTINRSKPNNGADHVVVEKGQTYYTWHPKGSRWLVSLEKPDLRDAWTKELEDWQSRVQEAVDEFPEDQKEDLRSELQERRDELQSNLDAMPEQLQESSVLNERIEELDDLINELD